MSQNPSVLTGTHVAVAFLATDDEDILMAAGRRAIRLWRSHLRYHDAFEVWAPRVSRGDINITGDSRRWEWIRISNVVWAGRDLEPDGICLDKVEVPL